MSLNASHGKSGGQAAAIADATIAGYRLVFWIAAAVFLAGAALAAVLFRSGPLPVDADAESIPAL